MTGKKYDEYKEVFKDIINEFNKEKENNNVNNTIKENNEENNNENYNNDINNNLESINNMINQDNENNNNKQEKKVEEKNNLENNNNNSPVNNENNNTNDEQKKKGEKRDIDSWLSDMNVKIELLSETVSKSTEANNSKTNININDEENNYEYIYKKLQKINAEKNKKDLETIFNEMHEIDLNIRSIDNNLDQCLNNSEVDKINGKMLKDLNKALDNTINKLVKNLDLNGKLKENAFENNI